MADEQPFFQEEDPTPVGDTDKVHDELRSVDLPPGHPSQSEVKRREKSGEDEDVGSGEPKEESGAEAMPGIPTEGEPPSAG